MAGDAHGNPLYFEISGGQVHDAKMASNLIAKLDGEILIADKGYDSEVIRDQARSRNMRPVIPKRMNTKNPETNFDRDLYRHRHLIENLFARLKHFRGIATRFEKLARNFKASLALACAFIWLKLHDRK